MTITYRPDRAGTAQILLSTYRGAVHGAAERVAGAVRSSWPDADVVVDDYVTDRSASSVTIREPDARLRVVRDGLLIRDAAAVGLEVRSR